MTALPDDPEHDRLWNAVLAAEEWQVREPNSFGAALALSIALTRYANFMRHAERCAQVIDLKKEWLS